MDQGNLWRGHKSAKLTIFRGLGALICEKFAAEGANIAVNYASSKDRAEEVAKKVELFGVKAICIKADCGVPEDNVRLVKETIEGLGGIDVIVANAGWTRFADFGDLNDLSLEEWNKCWACNVMSHLQLVQAAGSTMSANADGGAYIITSSVAVISHLILCNPIQLTTCREFQQGVAPWATP